MKKNKIAKLNAKQEKIENKLTKLNKIQNIKKESNFIKNTAIIILAIITLGVLGLLAYDFIMHKSITTPLTWILGLLVGSWVTLLGNKLLNSMISKLFNKVVDNIPSYKTNDIKKESEEDKKNSDW